MAAFSKKYRGIKKKSGKGRLLWQNWIRTTQYAIRLRLPNRAEESTLNPHCEERRGNLQLMLNEG